MRLRYAAAALAVTAALAVFLDLGLLQRIEESSPAAASKELRTLPAVSMPGEDRSALETAEPLSEQQQRLAELWEKHQKEFAAFAKVQSFVKSRSLSYVFEGCKMLRCQIHAESFIRPAGSPNWIRLLHN